MHANVRRGSSVDITRRLLNDTYEFLSFHELCDVAANNTYPERKLEDRDESNAVVVIVDFSTTKRRKEKMREKERQGHDRANGRRV